MAFASVKKTEQSAFIERRGTIQCRRYGSDRRQAKDPSYRGPSRRMQLDRRMNIRDRRQQTP